MALLLVQPRTNVIKNKNLEGGFYDSLRILLIVLKFTGLFPLSGIRHGTSESPRLKWRSWYTLVYVYNVCLLVFQIITVTLNIITTGCRTENLNDFSVKFTILFIVASTFFTICKNWQQFIRTIEDIEICLPPIRKQRNYLTFVLITYTLVSFMNHIFFIMYSYSNHTRCRTVAVNNYFHVEENYFPFNYIVALLLLIKRIQNDFALYSIDAIVILISLHLITRVKSFNSLFQQKVNQAHKQTPNWWELQMYFTRISRLVKFVNEKINQLVLASFFINLLYVSQQTYIILNNLTSGKVSKNPDCLHGPSFVSVIFICYTFCYVSIKVAIICLVAGELHTLSREPLNALYTLPASAYNREFQKFMTQVYHSRVCLTGINLFEITRGTLLKIVATLMTYELVLLQI